MTAEFDSTVDRLCAQLEESWNTGAPRSIEDLTEKSAISDELSLRLLPELVATEIELRRWAGQSPAPADYQSRFPELKLEHFFADSPTKTVILADSLTKTINQPRRLPQIDGYEILREIGRGGMGVVYKAMDPRLNRVVALKLLLQGIHPNNQKRFQNEAKMIARMRHSGIIQLHRVGFHQNQPYLVLEHVEGGGLNRFLGEPIPPRTAAKFMEKVARAVHHAHLHDVIHRDLTPGNILVRFDAASRTKESSNASKPKLLEGPLANAEPRITDFGLSKLTYTAEKLTQTGMLLGTPTYMPPEQSLGGEISEASDIYSLGAVLYEMLTGRPPFKARDVIQTLELVQNSEVRSLRELQPDIPRDLETICLKCLEKNPKKRYRSAEQLADDLQNHLKGQEISARRSGLFERLGRKAKRNSLALIAGSWAISVVLCTCLLFRPPGSPPESASELPSESPPEPTLITASEPPSPPPSEPIAKISAVGDVTDLMNLVRNTNKNFEEEIDLNPELGSSEGCSFDIRLPDNYRLNFQLLREGKLGTDTGLCGETRIRLQFADWFTFLLLNHRADSRNPPLSGFNLFQRRYIDDLWAEGHPMVKEGLLLSDGEVDDVVIEVHSAPERDFGQVVVVVNGQEQYRWQGNLNSFTQFRNPTWDLSINQWNGRLRIKAASMTKLAPMEEVPQEPKSGYLFTVLKTVAIFTSIGDQKPAAVALFGQSPTHWERAFTAVREEMESLRPFLEKTLLVLLETIEDEGYRSRDKRSRNDPREER